MVFDEIKNKKAKIFEKYTFFITASWKYMVD
jgi:hypothetical protein